MYMRVTDIDLVSVSTNLRLAFLRQCGIILFLYYIIVLVL